MIILVDEMIKDKPKDCSKCSKEICERHTEKGVLHLFTSNNYTVYPPCMDKRAKGNFMLSIKDDETYLYETLLAAITDIVNSSKLEDSLEKHLELIKIKSKYDK